MGCQVGEARREQVQHSIENAHLLIEQSYSSLELTWDGAKIQSRKYSPFAWERYPQYIEEMQGIAKGANVPFDDVMVLNAMEAVTMDALHLTRCTSFAVNEERTADGHVLLAHNEDWLPEDEGDVYVISAKPKEEPPFLAMTYGGLLPNVGFNAYGIAQLIDSVYPNDSRIGIPRLVMARAVLASRRLSGALGRTLAPHRAAGYNHLLAGGADLVPRALLPRRPASAAKLETYHQDAAVDPKGPCQPAELDLQPQHSGYRSARPGEHDQRHGDRPDLTGDAYCLGQSVPEFVSYLSSE
jgi:isopenicillin-N N-acyltransferase-like protein